MAERVKKPEQKVGTDRKLESQVQKGRSNWTNLKLNEEPLNGAFLLSLMMAGNRPSLSGR